MSDPSELCDHQFEVVARETIEANDFFPEREYVVEWCSACGALKVPNEVRKPTRTLHEEMNKNFRQGRQP